jgi:hypothetical protein
VQFFGLDGHPGKCNVSRHGGEGFLAMLTKVNARTGQSAAARDVASDYTGKIMRVSGLLVFLTTSVNAVAAIGNVSVTGASSTQAILRYTAPDENACMVEVSESASFTPLVHDLDSTLFAGANVDNRSEGATNGSERVFVVGKRRAERASNGRWYSRALQAYTHHYYRITCGADQATGTFSTTNIPLGNTYNETVPADPNAGKAGYFVNGGEYAWPDFLSWDKNTARSETVIDPQTGMLLKRVTMPGDQPTGNWPAGDHNFATASSATGTWTSAANVLVDDGASASFSGAGRDWMVLRDSSLTFNGYYLESLTFSAKAWCSGPCPGEDAKIQVCLTVNGVSCWPDQNNVIDVALGSAANPSTYATAGSNLPIMAAWTPAGYLPLNLTDARSRSGSVNVDGAGAVTLAGGDLFYPNWVAGSRITIAGSVCNIASVSNPKMLTIDPASCAPALNLPLSNAAYSAGNFGVMIRKKTTSLDTIFIQYAKYALSESNGPGWSASGSPEFCSETLIQNSVTGAMGYHCVFTSGQMYWINNATGDANYLGLLWVFGQSGADGWQSGGCVAASTTLIGTGPRDPEKFYCSVNDNAGNPIILACTLTSTNQPGSLTTSCTNLTKGSLGLHMNALLTQFTAGYTPSYDTTKYTGCGIVGVQNRQLIMGCFRGYQDSIGWIVVFSPEKVDTAPGCVGGGNPGCVVAAQASWATAPARWCVIHTIFMAGNGSTSWILGKYMGPTGQPGSAPHMSTVLSGSVESQPSIAAGVNGCPPGSDGCDLVVVDGEPCNPTPAPLAGGHPAEGGNCPKNSAWEYLQDAQPGDIFLLNSNTEYVRLISKNGNAWLIERGYGFTNPSAPTTPVTMSEICTSRRFDYGASGSDWIWDFEHDPHALNASGATVKMGPGYTHPVARPNVVIGGVAWVDVSPSVYGYAITDGPGYVPPNKYSALGPYFAGTYGLAGFDESAQDHPSHPQSTAPPKEQKWFLDARPLHGPGPSLVDQATRVSGQLYKFGSTTGDGDNLSYLGGPNAYLGKVNRKHQPTMARCGTQPLIDVSSATMGDAIPDDSSGAYQYCVARRAGECRTGSAPGDIFVNCPYVAPRPDRTLGCDYERGEPSLANDVCISNTGAYLEAVAQIGYEHSDPTGALARVLTKGLNRYNVTDVNENVHSLPDASWLLVESNAVQGAMNSILAAKLPPYPEVDSVNRTTFVPVAVNLPPPGDPNVDNAVVLFGYLENGSPNQFFCTTRREACLAVSSGINEGNPFRFGSEGTDGSATTVTGVSCANGCSVAIPGLSQRVVYYQVLYRDGNNAGLRQGPLQMTVVP